MSKTLEVFEKRCLDCPNCHKKNGILVCEECFNQECKNIDDCPLGITVEEIEQIEKNAKENKVKNVARSVEPKKERKPKEKKQDLPKEELIKNLAEFMQELAENVKISNPTKMVEFDLGGDHFTLNLTRQRKPKVK